MGKAVALWIGGVGLLFSVSAFAGGARIVSPREGGIAIGPTLTVQVDLSRKCSFQAATLDGRALNTSWRDASYAGRKEADLNLEGLARGEHELELSLKCRRKHVTLKRRFERGHWIDSTLSEKLVQHYLSLHASRTMPWDWEDAVFLYGLGVAAQQNLRLRPLAQKTLTEFNQNWLNKGLPKIDRSDRCAPALAALVAARDFNQPTARELLEPVLHYLKNEPRNRLGALDHLGHSWLSKFYPSSIWVDSLMMYGVLSVQLGRYLQDRELFDFGARQAEIFASVLQDGETGLFSHAYLIRRGRVVPRQEAYWLRGNGWVTTALSETLEGLWLEGKWIQLEAVQKILERQVESLRKYQQPSGLWDSILNDPGYSYEETSGAALVAYGIAKAVRLGFLPHQDLEVARKAFAGVLAQLEKTEAGYSMTGISNVTNAFSKRAYRRVHRTRDLGYGVGALLLAASELDLQTGASK